MHVHLTAVEREVLLDRIRRHVVQYTDAAALAALDLCRRLETLLADEREEE